MTNLKFFKITKKRNFGPFMASFATKIVLKCDRTSHGRKRAARTSHARFKMLFARTSHTCECARTCACANLISQLTV